MVYNREKVEDTGGGTGSGHIEGVDTGGYEHTVGMVLMDVQILELLVLVLEKVDIKMLHMEEDIVEEDMF